MIAAELPNYSTPASSSAYWLGYFPDPYSNGNCYLGDQLPSGGIEWFGLGGDLSFETFVEPIPEPVAATMLTVAAGLLVIGRRLRRPQG